MPAICAASARTRGISASGSVTALTRPMRSASSASMTAPVIDQLARARHAHAPGEPLGAAEARDDAEPDLGRPNFAVRAA